MIFPTIMNIRKIIWDIVRKVFRNYRFIGYKENFDPKNYIKVVLLFLTEQKKKILLLPINFKPDEFIIKFPPIDYGFPADKKFRIDKMNYILGLLSEIPANNKDLITENGYIPIHSKTIRNNIKDYLLYLNYLIASKVIQCDDYYIVEEKSMGYKWTEQYENSEFIVFNRIGIIEGEDKRIDEKINPICRIENYPYLNYWYQQKKLTIDSQNANAYALYLKTFKMQESNRWDFNSVTRQMKNPLTQYKAVLYNIGSIDRLDYRLKIDDNVHRLHSVITNMQKDFRNYLTYNNEPLVSIDIKNSQPYLTCILFNPEFWNENSNLLLNLKSLPLNIQARLNEFSIINMLGKFFDGLKGNEFNEYARIVSTGGMYEALIDIVREERGDTITRKDAKITMFSIFFSKNKGSQNNPNKDLMDIFKLKFPAIAELFKIIKHSFKDGDDEQHSRLACLLQSIESEIVLHRCCKRIWKEGENSIPLFTIHDSIITTTKNLESVYLIMIEELHNCIGVEPSLEIEYWDEKNIIKKN